VQRHEVRLEIICPLSIENYNAEDIKYRVAAAAGVDEARVRVSITASSVRIQATIVGENATDADSMRTTLDATFSDADAAVSTLVRSRPRSGL
jgi:hypothetical protein